MGCLKVNIAPVYSGFSVDMKHVGGISVVIGLVKRARRCITAFFREVSDIVTRVAAVNDDTCISIDHAYPKIRVTLGLTCLTDLNDEFYLEVLDGYVITLKGCYVKVLKG